MLAMSMCTLTSMWGKAAYIEGRYNPKFVVTREDIDALMPRVELLREITQRICEERIKRSKPSIRGIFRVYFLSLLICY